MISKEEVQHIAELARLELTGEEVEKIQKDLSAILDYFELLKKAPKPKSPPAFVNTLAVEARKDEIKNRDDRMAEKIISAFPDKKDDYIKVKTIL